MKLKKLTLCDDHPIVREGLKQLIQSLEHYEVLDDVASGEALLKSMRYNLPEIVILDVSLPGSSGLEVLKSIKTIYPEVKVLVLSMYPEDQFAIRMIKAGASGYLHKDTEPKLLLKALDKISRGEEYMSPSLTKLLIGAIHKKDASAPKHETLSDREFEVFLALGEGYSLGEIGLKLNLSVKTISTYKSRVYEKMGLTNNSDLVRYIMDNSLDLEKQKA